MKENKTIEKLKELGIYTSEEQEPIEDYLEGKSFWDARGNEWNLITWIEKALTTHTKEVLQELLEECEGMKHTELDCGDDGCETNHALHDIQNIIREKLGGKE